MSRHACTWWAPGRVNLIGEHTDYNDGFALPFAIEQGCTATVELAAGDQPAISSAQNPDTGWTGYVRGVVAAMQDRGVDVPGLRIHVDSTVPIGAGLSSSAALICSVAAAVDDLLGLALSPDDLLAITRRAENDYVGAPTGGLDQLAALRSTVGHALLCDFRDLTTQQVAFDLDAAGLALLVIDTATRHQHAGGEYAARRAACELAARQLGVSALRDVHVDGLADALLELEAADLWRCVRHVVTENDRVLQAFARLERGEIASIGPLLTESHASLRDEYRVSVEQLDAAVQTALDVGAHGARMTGGGFGGCVIALLDDDLVDECEAAVAAAFTARGFGAPTCFRTRAGPGAHRVD
jgi:galactokinase